MKSSRTLALVILSSAILVALVLVFQTKKSLNSEASLVSSPSPTPFSLIKTQGKLPAGSLSLLDLNPSNSSKNQENLTEGLAKVIFQGFQEANQTDFDPQKGLKVPEEEKILKGFSQLNKFNFFQEYYDFKDLKLIADSPENQKNYLLRLVEIFKKYQKDPEEVLKTFENWGETQDVNYLKTFLAQYHLPLLKELSQVPVPSSLAGFQKEILNALSAEKEIFQAMVDYQNDPLKAILALDNIPLAMEKLADLNLRFYQKLEAFKISL